MKFITFTYYLMLLICQNKWLLNKQGLFLLLFQCHDDFLPYQQNWQQLFNIDSLCLYELPHHVSETQTQTHTGKETEQEPEGIISTEQRESQSKQHREQHWGQTEASTSSPFQDIWAVLTLQTVGHTAPALLVVMHYLYLNTQQIDNTDSWLSWSNCSSWSII